MTSTEELDVDGEDEVLPSNAKYERTLKVFALCQCMVVCRSEETVLVSASNTLEEAIVDLGRSAF